jgi:thiol-disulfide isomerase/thioredoxin
MDLLQDFIRTNPKSIVSASLLAGYSRSWGKKFSEPLFEGLAEEIKQSRYGEQISKYLRVNNQPNLGEKYADIKMKDPVGLDRKLSDLAGNVILLEFWASWCKPCRDQNPELLNIYNVNRNKGFEIFAVSLDSDASRWTEAIATDKLPWIQVSDLQGDANEAAQIYGVSGVPDNFLIDQNGMVVGRDLRGEALSAKLIEILSD